MSGLRTLKDIEHTIHLTNIIAELREAAKEWVLDLREAIKDSTGDSHIERWEWEAQIEWIETFFNLEDEGK